MNITKKAAESALIFILMIAVFCPFFGTKDVSIAIPVFIGMVISGRSLNEKFSWCIFFIVVSIFYLVSHNNINVPEYDIFLLLSFVFLLLSLSSKRYLLNRTNIQQSLFLIIPSLSSITSLYALMAEDYSSVFVNISYTLLLVKAIIFIIMSSSLVFGLAICFLPVWMFFTSGNDNKKFVCSILTPLVSAFSTSLMVYYLSDEYSGIELYQELAIVPLAVCSYLFSSSIIFLVMIRLGLNVFPRKV